ncbi:MAG: DUF418 domain-containing protein [Pseudomonadota bacterium]
MSDLGVRRIEELDVLRGFALLGVFIVHFVGLNFYELPPADIQATWQTDPFQRGISLFSDIFFQNSANTLFAMLFGMSFWLMLERMKANGVAFETVYIRRLVALMVIGLIHLCLIFPGDVLFEYALLGLVLFLIRGMPPLLMLAIGIMLFFLGQPIGDQISTWLTPPDHEESSQSVFQGEDYISWATSAFSLYFSQNIAYGSGLGWWLYILGRFMLGAWIMQQVWMRRLSEYRGVAGQIAVFALPIGLLLETVSIFVAIDYLPWPNWIDPVTHSIGAPLVALGYAATLVYLFTGSSTQRLVHWLAPVGRIALTAYVAHGLLFSIIFLPLGPNLTGIITPFASFGVAIGLYISLTVASILWLKHYRYGPLEFVWRWATYGRRPDLSAKA